MERCYLRLGQCHKIVPAETLQNMGILIVSEGPAMNHSVEMSYGQWRSLNPDNGVAANEVAYNCRVLLRERHGTGAGLRIYEEPKTLVYVDFGGIRFHIPVEELNHPDEIVENEIKIETTFEGLLKLANQGTTLITQCDKKIDGEVVIRDEE